MTPTPCEFDVASRYRFPLYPSEYNALELLRGRISWRGYEAGHRGCAERCHTYAYTPVVPSLPYPPYFFFKNLYKTKRGVGPYGVTKKKLDVGENGGTGVRPPPELIYVWVYVSQCSAYPPRPRGGGTARQLLHCSDVASQHHPAIWPLSINLAFPWHHLARG